MSSFDEDLDNDDDEDSVTPRCQVEQNDKEEYVTHEGRSRFYGDPDPRSNDEASDARSTESTSATVELQQDTQRRENEEKE